MRKSIIAALFSLVSLIPVSCSKMDALFNNGEPVTETRTASENFDIICMYNNVNINLIQSNHPHFELTCPKNLIDNIVTEIRNDSLIIRNYNDYNWLRSYDYTIDLNVYFDSLYEINYASTARLTTQDTLTGICIPDTTDGFNRRTFMLRTKEGCGDIDLTFNCEVLRNRFFNGTSHITLRGIAGYTEHIVRSYGTVHAETLDSNIVTAVSESTNDIYLKVRDGGSLRAELYSIGNLYYIGEYVNPIVQYHGEGRVIKLE